MTVTKGGKRKDGTQTRYFSCTGKSHNRICKGINKPVYAENLEDTVYMLISEKIKTLKGHRKKISADNTNQINVLKNKISMVNKEQERIVNILLNDDVGADMINLLNEKAKKLADEKNDVLSKIDALANGESEIINVINLTEKWKTADFEQRKAVCSVLIHKIVINGNGNCRIIWNV